MAVTDFIEALPPLPPPSEITPERLAQIQSQRKFDLRLPSGWNDALQARGWFRAGANEMYVFFERPGYWLRIFRVYGEWSATVMPAHLRVPRPELGSAGYNLRFPDHMLPPEFRGKGARAKALAAATVLWQEHEGYLAALGIQLTAVGVRQFLGSGSGGYVDSRSYRHRDLFPER